MRDDNEIQIAIDREPAWPAACNAWQEAIRVDRSARMRTRAPFFGRQESAYSMFDVGVHLQIVRSRID